MKDTKSSLLLYIIYRYLFGILIAIICLGTIKQFIDGSITFDGVNLDVLKSNATLVTILLGLQLIASRFVFRATINKKEIRLDGQTIKWDNVKSINRLHHIYILKTKDKKRFYLFPTEKQSNLLFGQKIAYTNMDQIINIKTTG